MPWPAGVITRNVTFSLAVIAETGVNVTAARASVRTNGTVIHLGTGIPLFSIGSSFTADFALPVTDQDLTYGDGQGNVLRTTNGGHTHTYHVSLEYQVGGTWYSGRIFEHLVVPTDAAALDLDLAISTGFQSEPVRVTIPDAWTTKAFQFVSVLDFGAVGDGVNDDTAEIQAAIDYAETLLNGAVVYFPLGNYKISSTLTVNKGILLAGSGYGDLTPVTSTAMTSATQGTKITWAGGAATMIRFVAAIANETLHGGGIEGLIVDAANLATTCVQLSSCRNTKIDIAARRYITQGILLDDTNGRLISEIYIPRFIGRIESNALTWNAHGINIKGDYSVTGFGATSIYMGELDIEHENGDALRFEDVDSCYVGRLKAVNRTAGYTGYGVRFVAGDGAFPCQKNYIAHLGRGRVLAETGTRNAIGFANSEGGNAGGPGIVHYRVIDRVTGELFETLVHKMSQWITLPANSLAGTATDNVASGNNWAIKAFDAAVQQYLSGAVPMPPDTEKGEITKIEVLLCRAQVGDANNDVRLQAELMVVADNGAFTAAPTSKIITQTIPAATGVLQRVIITFDAPVAVVTRDRSVFLKLTRVAADAADTYTGLLGVFALRVYFAGTGPDDAGTGPWYIPPVSV